MPEPRDGLIVHSSHPFNAEPPLAQLAAAFLTPQPGFYVRSHGAVPRLDPAGYALRVFGRVARPLELTLDALRQRFPERRIVAAMQCAGNRRADLHALRPVTGDPWAGGAIGNAEWAGVPLAELLREAGAESGAGLHVAFHAADMVEQPDTSFPFAVSIPLDKALAPEVILAWGMNGEALSPEHGSPLRAVVPGYAGIRSAKWLTAIELRDSEADAPIQRSDYKLLPPDIRKETVDWSRGLTINEMPLNSAICEPARGAALPAGRTVLRGWAVASGRPVARVDVSANGGRSWTQAALHRNGAAPWGWTLWDAALDLAPGEHELVVRAWDAAMQTQPATPDEVWNFKGYLSAAWHRVPVSVSGAAPR